ncbi:hypothetical protein NST69_14780 [Paenibacillus sp. FSL P2-0089]|uniref:hypothetical protein n=1 Tax=Paenibacillus sp. FSL P2-0089 TaxID=2954526 RepID=UPI00315B07EE
MNRYIYNFLDEITNIYDDIWIQGTHDTGKTTFLKYLYDLDSRHSHKWLIGGCSPIHSLRYYNTIIENITRMTFKPGSSLCIYIDEIEDKNLKKIKDTINKLKIPVRLVVASHNSPNDNTGFIKYEMSKILSLATLIEHFKNQLPDDSLFLYAQNIADFFYLLDHIEDINSDMDIKSIIRSNQIITEDRQHTKKTIGHSIFRFNATEYEQITVLKFKELE